MNRNRIFYIYQDSNTKYSNIDSLIKVEYKPENKQEYYNHAKQYLATKAQQFITFHNKQLDIKEYELFTIPYLPKTLFLIILTKTNTNHPYGVYVDLDSNLLNFIIPFGKDRKQADIEDYDFAITNATGSSAPSELAMIYIILEKTILIRKKAILTPGHFTLLDCSNITGCIKKKNEIAKKNISTNQKQELISRYNQYYINKAIIVLRKYFELLDGQNWDEAYSYLKGKETKYFGKERVNTFFKNTKKIIGHLEIFISIYQLFFHSRDSLKSKLNYR